MIQPRETIQQVADKVRHLTARIPRQPRTLKAEPYEKVRMKEAGKRIAGVEESQAGIRARICLLEHRVEKLSREMKTVLDLAAWVNRLESRLNIAEEERRELARENRSLADEIARAKRKGLL